MNHVNCPHCNGPIADDGLNAGQVVSCPHCSNRLTMPAIEAIAVNPYIAPRTSTRRKSREKQSYSVGALGIAGGIFLGFVLIGGAVYLYVSYQWSQAKEAVKEHFEKSHKADKVAEKERRMAVSQEPEMLVTASEVTNEYDENAVRGELRYKNKVIAVKGKVRHIGSLDGEAYLSLEGHAPENLYATSITCDFADSEKMKVAALKTDDLITVIGKCEGKGDGWSSSRTISLTHCKLAPR